MDHKRFDHLTRNVGTRRSFVAAVAAAALSLGTGRRAFAASQLTLSISQGKVGATVTASMSGFRAGEDIRLAWFDGTTSHRLKSLEASGNGSAATTFKVPAAVRGSHLVQAKGLQSGKTASVSFTVITSIVVTPKEMLRTGDTAKVIVRGYLAATRLSARWFETGAAGSAYDVVSSAVTDATGGVTLSFPVPEPADFLPHLLQIRAPGGVKLLVQTLLNCPAGAVSDQSGGCCMPFHQPATGRAECCSRSWNPNTELCVLNPGQHSCSTDADCATNDCDDIYDVCTLGSSGREGETCWGDAGCTSGNCPVATNTCACALNGHWGLTDPGEYRSRCCSGHNRPVVSGNPICCGIAGAACSSNNECCELKCSGGVCQGALGSSCENGPCCCGYACNQNSVCVCLPAGAECRATCCNGACLPDGTCP